MTGFQLWNIEQLENKLVDMREMYNDRICGTSNSDFPGSSSGSSSGVCEDEDFESDASYLIDTHFSSQVKIFLNLGAIGGGQKIFSGNDPSRGKNMRKIRI
jgi:hypothetical protein